MSGRERFVIRATLYARGVYLACLLHAWPLHRVTARVRRPDRLGIRADWCVSPETAAELIERLFGRWTLPFTSRCLVESLLLFALLHPVVPQVRLDIGLKVEGEYPFSVTGHAWVSVDGRPLLARDRTAPSTFRSVMAVSGSRHVFPLQRRGSVWAVR
ncbi:MAG: lasso peptide biosynthesis protein [Acidobacteria bacterium]|nr:lasso peptide biosynthesis protein [Acidobacteriota bacterium]